MPTNDEDKAAEPDLVEQSVLYLDFLGSSDAAKSWNGQRMSGLIDLLIGLSRGKSSFDLQGAAQPDGSYKITYKLAVTTFSDHVVASFPVMKELEVTGFVAAEHFIDRCRDYVTDIALAALQ